MGFYIAIAVGGSVFLVWMIDREDPMPVAIRKAAGAICILLGSILILLAK